MQASEIDINATIALNCSVAYSSNVRLYRGTNHSEESFIGTIRTNRRPRSSTPESADIFDMFMEALDLPFRKSNTLSTTIKRYQTQTYGPYCFRIYPFDGSQYLGSAGGGPAEARFTDLMAVPIYIRNQFYRNYNPDTTPNIQTFIEQNAQELKAQCHLVVADSPSAFVDGAGEVLVYGRQYAAIQHIIGTDI